MSTSRRGRRGQAFDRSSDVIYDIIMLKVVLDTSVMVAAFDSPRGASRQLLLEILDGRAVLLLSTSLMLEYEAVLTRPTVLQMIGIEAAEVIDVLDELAAGCQPVVFDYRL